MIFNLFNNIFQLDATLICIAIFDMLGTYSITFSWNCSSCHSAREGSCKVTEERFRYRECFVIGDRIYIAIIDELLDCHTINMPCRRLPSMLDDCLSLYGWEQDLNICWMCLLIEGAIEKLWVWIDGQMWCVGWGRNMKKRSETNIEASVVNAWLKESEVMERRLLRVRLVIWRSMTKPFIYAYGNETKPFICIYSTEFEHKQLKSGDFQQEQTMEGQIGLMWEHIMRECMK